jgi:RimJ/RimL family protein N-acetyltransferase
VLWSLTHGAELVGITTLKDIDWVNRQASSNIMIGNSALWGRGYAGEAVRLRTSFAFRELGLERLETESFVENTGMHLALERSGYRKLGTRRHCIYRDGAWHDLFVFELLRSDWQDQGRHARAG